MHAAAAFLIVAVPLQAAAFGFSNALAFGLFVLAATIGSLKEGLDAMWATDGGNIIDVVAWIVGAALGWIVAGIEAGA